MTIFHANENRFFEGTTTIMMLAKSIDSAAHGWPGGHSSRDK